MFSGLHIFWSLPPEMDMRRAGRWLSLHGYVFMVAIDEAIIHSQPAEKELLRSGV